MDVIVIINSNIIIQKQILVVGKEEKARVAECVEIEEDEDAVVLRRLTSHISHQLSGHFDYSISK